MLDAVGCGGAGLNAETSSINTGTETPPLVRTRPHTPSLVKNSRDSSANQHIQTIDLSRILLVNSTKIDGQPPSRERETLCGSRVTRQRSGPAHASRRHFAE